MTTAVVGPFIITTYRARFHASSLRWSSEFCIVHADDLSETPVQHSRGAQTLTPLSAERDAMELAKELAVRLGAFA